MSESPKIDNWIIGPAAQLENLIKEAAYVGTIPKALVIAANFRSYLQMSRSLMLCRGKSTAAIDLAIQHQDGIEFGARSLLSEGSDEVPIIFKHSLIGLWTFVELIVEDTAILILTRSLEGVGLAASQGGKKFPGGGTRLLTEEEAREVAGLLDRVAPEKGDLNAASRVPRFMARLGVPFTPTNEVHEKVVELCAIRNCLVHRNGLVDERTVKAAPSLSLVSGKSLVVSSQIWRRCYDAVGAYSSQLTQACARSPYATWWDSKSSTLVPGPELDAFRAHRDREGGP